MQRLVNTDSKDFGPRITNLINAMLAYWDKNQVCQFANNAYMEWFGKTPEEMIGKITMKELLGPLYEKNLPHIKAALRGHLQVFEREIPLPAGGSRHSIATYYPDIMEGRVLGFFVHVADVTPIKLLEARLLEVEKSKKRDVLKSVMEAQEKEKEIIADNLRDSVNQTLAYCKMMLQNSTRKKTDPALLDEITKNIQQAISELNLLSSNLSTSSIRHFGLVPGLQDYIDKLETNWQGTVVLECWNRQIEELKLIDKIAIFRIVQGYLLIQTADPTVVTICLNIYYDRSLLLLQFSSEKASLDIPLHSKEYLDIQNRVEYYDGTITRLQEENKQILQIKMGISTPGRINKTKTRLPHSR